MSALKELAAMCDRYEELYECKLPWWWWLERRDRRAIRFLVKDLRMTVLRTYDPWPRPDEPNQYGLRKGDDIS